MPLLSSNSRRFSRSRSHTVREYRPVIPTVRERVQVVRPDPCQELARLRAVLEAAAAERRN